MLSIGKHVVEWVAKRVRATDGLGTDIGIGWEKHGELIAGVAYANWNGVNVECHIASDGSRRWLTREYLWTIFHYPFCQLGAKRITVCVAQGNADSARFVKHLGFTIEARLKDAHPTGDIQIFCMNRRDCRFIQMESHDGKRDITAARA